MCALSFIILDTRFYLQSLLRTSTDHSCLIVTPFGVKGNCSCMGSHRPPAWIMFYLSYHTNALEFSTGVSTHMNTLYMNMIFGLLNDQWTKTSYPTGESYLKYSIKLMKLIFPIKTYSLQLCIVLNGSAVMTCKYNFLTICCQHINYLASHIVSHDAIRHMSM